MFSALAARDSPAATPSEMCPYRESDCNQEDITPAGALYFLTSNNGSAEAQALSHFSKRYTSLLSKLNCYVV